MTKKTFVLLIILFSGFRTIAQDTGLQPLEITEYNAVNGRLREFDLSVPVVKGTDYLYDDWGVGTIYFKQNQILDDIFLKYDLQNKLVEIKFRNNTIRTVNEIWIDSLRIVDPERSKVEHFVNGKFFEYNAIKMDGLWQYEPIKGQYSLAKKYYLKVIESNYMPELNSGTDETRLVVRSDVYIVENANNNLLEAPKNWNSLYKLIGDEKKASLIKQYKKKNSISLKNHDDLIRLIKYLNQLYS